MIDIFIMNNTEDLAVIILAAGMGKRMQSDLPKVLARANDIPLIEHVLAYITPLNPKKTIIVVGHKGELVKETVSEDAQSGRYTNNFEFCTQVQQLGTGDAVKAALPALEGFVGTVLILCGDVPLIKTESLEKLISIHNENNATLTLITMITDGNNAYGRIVRNSKGELSKIVEFKDCSEEEKQIKEANAGIYAVDSAFLKPAIESLKNDNNQHEYYITDIVAKAVSEGQIVASSINDSEEEFQGVNTKDELKRIEEVLLKRKN